MTRKQAVKNWIFKADKDVETANDLFRLGHYDWCLFIWHIAIEKVIKAHIMQSDREFTYTHKLINLAKQAGIPLTDEEKDQLREITTYNLNARYDLYKLAFYKKATKPYTQKWVAICNDLYEKFKENI